MTEFGKCKGGGRRLAARETATLITIYTTVTHSHAAFLVDVSQTGARLRGDILPEKSDEIMLSIDAVRAFGTVIWSRRGECGVAFDSPLEAEDVELLRERVAKAAGFAPEVKAAMDDWTMGLAR